MLRGLALLTLLSAVALSACAGQSGLDSGKSKPAQPDRVVGVTVRCLLTVLSLRTHEFDTRDAIDADCTPVDSKAPARFLGNNPSLLMMSVANVRAVVTVRTPPGGSYTIETPDTSVKVGDSWPK